MQDGSNQVVRRQLEKVLSSPGFARNERLSAFLQFIVEQELSGRGEQLKETIIGVEVFGKRPDYDVRRDSLVRTEAARLRVRLAEYYSDGGRADALIIDVPKGGYRPKFHTSIGVQDTLPHPLQVRRRPGPVWLPAALACCLVLGLGFAGWRRFYQNAPIPIAVLPLINLSQDANGDYFADGLTSEIIRNLSIIDGLAVRSQTSVLAFKGKPRNLRDAGKQLDVDYILEGSVLRAGPRLRIIASLVRVRDDVPLWSGKYDREATDIFSIQDEISRGIVNSLRLKLGRGRRRYETSTEAYDLYLRALGLRIQRSTAGADQGVPLLEQATAKDPAFAPAYAVLAIDYALRSGQFRFDIPEEVDKMRAAAEKAIQLDPLSADALDALGMSYARLAKWEQSERSFRRAIELEPGRSDSRLWFAQFYLEPLGRVGDAFHQLRIAEKADPLSNAVEYDLSVTLRAVGRYDEASFACEKMNSETPLKNMCLADVRLNKGKTEEVIRTLEPEFKRGVAPGALIRAVLGCAYARAGRREDAERTAAGGSVNPLNRAEILACLGDKNRTFEARIARPQPGRYGWAGC